MRDKEKKEPEVPVKVEPVQPTQTVEPEVKNHGHFGHPQGQEVKFPKRIPR